MRLPNSEHTSRPWRIHELTHDFRLEDVWALPTPGGPNDFPRLVQQRVSFDPMDNPSPVFRGLFAIRIKLGQLLGRNGKEEKAPSKAPADEATIRDRLPQDLRESPGPDFKSVPFKSLYLLDDESAWELATKTVHGVLHFSWVKDETGGGYRGQMAVLVRPTGVIGKAYMAAIKPFRLLLVYPALMRNIGRQWEAGRPAEAPAPAAEEQVDSAAAVR